MTTNHPRTSRRRAVVALAALLLAGAVGTLPGCDRPDRPEEPVWGKTACAHCAMLVSDKRYAAQLTRGGERFFFDDVGCLVSWLDERGNAASPDLRSWVRDAETSTWVDATSARYASGAKTPMDFGFESKRGGTLGFEDVRRGVAEKRGKR